VNLKHSNKNKSDSYKQVDTLATEEISVHDEKKCWFDLYTVYSEWTYECGPQLHT